MSKKIWIAAFVLSGAVVVGPRPVSYTHLDVYKRQALAIGIVAIALGK